MDAVQQHIQNSLEKNRKNFEGIGLVLAGTPRIIALETHDDAQENLVAAMKRFLYRIAIDTDNIHQLEVVNNVIYYDLHERQIICNLVKGDPEDYILVIVTGPKKAYKRATKQLLKALQATLATRTR